MLFLDYELTLLPDGSIMLDPELTKDKILAQEGDRFVLHELENKRLILKKLQGVQAFIDAGLDKDSNISRGYN